MEKKLSFYQFDTNINKPLEKLVEMANRQLTNRAYYLSVTYWDDTDFELELRSSWGDYIDVFSYKKSTNQFIQYKQKKEELNIIEVLDKYNSDDDN